MFSVTQDTVPEGSLLRTYRGGARPECWRGQGDCFTACIDRRVALADFVLAFYTSPVFRIERLILFVLAGAPSTDHEVRQLAEGTGVTLAVWRVGERTATQLLMCDRYERTRSWFSVVPLGEGQTMLQFGSAVAGSRSGPSAPGPWFRLLLRFHVLYSQVLLHAAKRALIRGAGGLR
jgi:hypothetical protein